MKKVLIEDVKIIVVEDEEEIRNLLVDIFEMFINRKVRSFDNAVQALEYITKAKVDIIISDVNMPGMNGFDFLKEVRKRNLDIIFIIMSAYPNCEQAIQFGADCYLGKPFRLQDVVKIVKKFITGEE